jgi:pantothenate kinase
VSAPGFIRGRNEPVGIEALAARIKEFGGEGRILVAISGPPGVGKSTFAGTLCDLLTATHPGAAAIVAMDGFHFDDRVLDPRGWRARKGAPHTFDVGGLRAMLGRLKANTENEIAVPVFDRKIEIARAGAALIVQSCPVILVEGNYLALNAAPWRDLAEFFDVTVRLEAPLAEIRRRLVERWHRHGLSDGAAKEKISENDLPNAKTVLENALPTDFVVTTVGPPSGMAP